MSGNKRLFSKLESLPLGLKCVILGDGITTTPITFIGTIDYIINGVRFIIHDVYYVPSLQDTLYSI